MKPGVYFSLSNAEYHSGDGISKSQLDDVAKCMAVYQWRQDAPEDTEKLDALTMGTALHCALLEPGDYATRFIEAPVFNRRATAGKEEEAAFYRETASQGKTILTAEQSRKIHLMRDSAYAHPYARWLLEAQGHAESSMYWIDPETGLLCRTRPDKFLSAMPLIVDVKKVADMSRFSRHIAEFRYHVQDAYYREGFKQNYGELPMFVFLVVSESIDCGRYPVRTFALTPYDVEAGAYQFRRDLNTYARALDLKEFGGIEEITRPEWDKRNDFQ